MTTTDQARALVIACLPVLEAIYASGKKNDYEPTDAEREALNGLATLIAEAESDILWDVPYPDGLITEKDWIVLNVVRRRSALRHAGVSELVVNGPPGATISHLIMPFARQQFLNDDAPRTAISFDSQELHIDAHSVYADEGHGFEVVITLIATGRTLLEFTNAIDVIGVIKAAPNGVTTPIFDARLCDLYCPAFYAAFASWRAAER
jgi:hypothetical protein